VKSNVQSQTGAGRVAGGLDRRGPARPETRSRSAEGQGSWEDVRRLAGGARFQARWVLHMVPAPAKGRPVLKKGLPKKHGKVL